MKKSIRLQQHEEIERLKEDLKKTQETLQQVYMILNLFGIETVPINQSVINAYKLGLEYAEAKHSGKLYEQIKSTN